MKGLTSAEAVGELRHELRTPLNLIIGYCEMLLEDATEPSQQAGLERALRGGRDILDRVTSALPSSRSEVTGPEIAALFASLRAPQEEVVAAATGLLDVNPGDPQWERDIRRIRAAAERLLTVEVPSGRVVGNATGSFEAPTTEPPATGPAVTPADILVVDDNEDNRAVLERRLGRQGHRVTSATGGRAALELARRERFDLVLLDVLMPDLDGMAVLQQLKADPATRDIPVIMISALDDVASVVRCIERGAEDHLPKPFDPVLLRARISACLEKKRLRDVELEYLREVDRVIEAASAVESGSYVAGGLAEVAQRDDALGRLARVFDTMADHVRARESRLRDQVAELRREIEAAKGTTRQEVVGDAPALPEGQVFAGRYQILEEVGSGGMGMVYRAFDQVLGEQVAIKTLRPELVRDPVSIERFKSEIRLARHISDRHVVRTHDFGDHEGTFYLTMEYVEGITVRQLIDQRGRLGMAATIAIATQLAQSLAVAHDEGVIHRDIKPQNLLLDANGVLKVMDFGVARLGNTSTGLTQAGMLVGTPAYMAPEQIASDSFDARADLYAAGVVLFECLTGRLPFLATTPVAMIAKTMMEAPPAPASLNPEISPALSALVLRLLAKEPDARPASGSELGRLLAELA